MSKSRKLGDQINASQRDLWVVTSLVILTMTAGVATMWPSVRQAITDRFGEKIPARVLLADFLFLVSFLVIYLWMKGGQLRRMVHRLVSQRGQNEELKVQLRTLRRILTSSSQLDQQAADCMANLLVSVGSILDAERAVLYRARAEHQMERDASWPRGKDAPPADLLSFEDALAQVVYRSGDTVLLWPEDDARELGISAPRPATLGTVAAAPLVLESGLVGVLVIGNPGGLLGETFDEEALEVLRIFAGFAAGVVRNVQSFQSVAQQNAELDRTRKSIEGQRHSYAEVETVTALSRIAYVMAHGISSPLTAISGYADLLAQSEPGSAEARAARQGINAEVINLRDRLQVMVDFTSTYRADYQMVDLNKVLHASLEDFLRQVGRDQVPVQVGFYKNLPLTMVDEVRIRQSLQTFLRVIHKSRGQGGSQEPIRIQTRPHSGRIRILIEFQGKPHVLASLEPFVHSNVEVGPVQRNQDVMCMAIATSILRNHQGDVSLDVQGSQACICLELPIHSEPPLSPRGVISVGPEEEPPTVEDVLDRLLAVGEGTAPSSLLQVPDEPDEVALPQEDSALGFLQGVRDEEPRPSRAAEAPGAATPVEPLPEAPAAAARVAPTPPKAPQGAPGSGLDELFGPGDVWRQEAERSASTVVQTHAMEDPVSQHPASTEPLLDRNEVEDALKLFDESATS